MPLSRALEGSYLSAFNGFLQKFILFAPLGGMIAVFVVSLKPSRRSIAGLVLLGLAAGFALFLEIGQLLLPSRSASFDDVIIGVAGLSFWVLNRERTQSSRADERSHHAPPMTSPSPLLLGMG